MGRHTRKPERGEVADEDGIRPGRDRWLGKVPLLPTVTGLLAIGAIVSAVSTKQISLNFAGGSPPSEPPVSGIVPTDAGHGGGNALTRGRASRGTARSPVAVTFRRTLVGTTGFHGEATLVNRGTATVTGWTLAFRYANTRVTRVSGAVLAHSGLTTIVRNLPGRSSIAPGQVVHVTFIAHGTARTPYLCQFNGKTC